MILKSKVRMIDRAMRCAWRSAAYTTMAAAGAGAGAGAGGGSGSGAMFNETSRYAAAEVWCVLPSAAEAHTRPAQVSRGSDVGEWRGELKVSATAGTHHREGWNEGTGCGCGVSCTPTDCG